MTIYNSLSNKIVLITGGTRGIGLSIAKEFLKKNHTVPRIFYAESHQGFSFFENQLFQPLND